jgi:hypothetical protein
MIRRIALWGIRSYFGGPAKSWAFSSMAAIVFRLVQSVTGRRELVDVLKVKPGDTLLIEQLSVSHKRQMKEMKKEKRQARRTRRLAAKSAGQAQ